MAEVSKSRLSSEAVARLAELKLSIPGASRESIISAFIELAPLTDEIIARALAIRGERRVHGTTKRVITELERLTDMNFDQLLKGVK